MISSSGEKLAKNVRFCDNAKVFIDLTYESFGDPKNPALLLVSGLGSQMTMWDDDLCLKLARAGPFYVVRYDNRDVGRSTHLDHMAVPSLLEMFAPGFVAKARIVCTGLLVSGFTQWVLTSHLAGVDGGGLWAATTALSVALGCFAGSRAKAARYTMEDMAMDGLALMDSLGIPKFHLVGVSMGGMIAQTMAIRSPERVMSLTSLMSMTGHPQSPSASLSVKRELSVAPPSLRPEDMIPFGVNTMKIINRGGTDPLDPLYFEKFMTRQVMRMVYRQGRARQIVAIGRQPNREPELRKLKMPVLVLHGKPDILVPVGNALRTAAAIPGSRLVIWDDCGHFIAPQHIDRFVKEVVSITKA